MLLALTILVGVLLFIAERKFPANNLPTVKAWYLRAALFNWLPLPFLLLAGLSWEPWLRHHALFELHTLPPALGGLLGFFAFQFALYWWHRWKHNNKMLWRTLHQLHHSAQRLEVLTAYYAHPMDFALNLLLSGSVLYGVMGLSVEAVAWFALIEGASDYLAHSNIATPRWLGYFAQRPEMHRVHHEYQLHRNNYALPLWDKLFGTYSNPPTSPARCGFDQDKEAEVTAMLLMQDVHQPKPWRCCGWQRQT
jgi:sterol desaturase/sphingolipid hydroxylase (fatty acid hydroxylase superfamily)